MLLQRIHSGCLLIVSFLLSTSSATCIDVHPSEDRGREDTRDLGKQELCTFSNVEMAKYFDTAYPTTNDIESSLIRAASDGNLHVLRCFLWDFTGNVSLEQSELPYDPKFYAKALLEAVKHDHLHIVEYLVKTHQGRKCFPAADPSAMKNAALAAAFANGSRAIIDVILGNDEEGNLLFPDLCIGAHSNIVLTSAVLAGRIEMVQFIVDRAETDNRFRPSLFSLPILEPFDGAIMANKLSIFVFLLQEIKERKAGFSEIPMWELLVKACENDRVEMVKELLSLDDDDEDEDDDDDNKTETENDNDNDNDDRKDHKDNMGKKDKTHALFYDTLDLTYLPLGFDTALNQGSVAVAEYLLELCKSKIPLYRPHLLPCERWLLWAVQNGQDRIVELLLEQDYSALSITGQMIEIAQEKGYTGIHDRLVAALARLA